MRWRRLVRTVLVYVLLGALSTVLTSWAIHAVQSWRAQTVQNRPVEFIPQVWWPVDLELAKRYGIDTTIRSGELGSDTDDGYLAREHSFYGEMGVPWRANADINADVVWRLNRCESDRLSPAPDYPFPYLLFDSDWTRAAWPVLVSEMRIINDAVEPEHVSIIETLFLVRPGWPVAAMEVGAHYAELIEFHPPHPTMHVSYAGFKRVEELAAPPAIAIPSGVELWAAPRPPVATGSAHSIVYAITDRFALPLLPIWPGFLINTIFYALLLLALVRVPRMARRALRRRRGRCVSCGYDRSGLDPSSACPECGRNRPRPLPIN